MRLVSDIAGALACLSAALAILYYLRRRRSPRGLPRQAGVAAIAGLLAITAAHLAALAASLWPGVPALDLVQLLAATAALGLAVAIWGLLPGLLAAPSSGALLEANKALSGAAAHNAEELTRLAASHVQLEQAVAERARAYDEARQRFEIALKNTNISMAQQDVDLRYVWAHNSPKGLSAETLIGRLQQDVLPQDTHLILAAAKREAMASQTAASLDIRMSIGGADRYFHENFEPLWRDGAVVGVLTTSVETTSYRRQQEELRGVLRELTHRTKNLLAVIMGIARQSGRTATDVGTFVARFNGRIRAIATTHELLVDSEWRGVGLRPLIAGVWRAVSPETRELMSLEGEDRLLTPESAQNLALAIYEMQSNALAHGGLIGPDGGVKIAWRKLAEDGGVELIWEQSGDPTAPAGDSDGFGKNFVETLLPRATKGRSLVQWRDHGLTWTLTLPAINFVDGAH